MPTKPSIYTVLAIIIEVYGLTDMSAGDTALSAGSAARSLAAWMFNDTLYASLYIKWQDSPPRVVYVRCALCILGSMVHAQPSVHALWVGTIAGVRCQCCRLNALPASGNTRQLGCIVQYTCRVAQKRAVDHRESKCGPNARRFWQ